MLVAFACVLLLALTTLVHFEVLGLLTSRLPALRVPPRTKLIAVIYAAFFAHALEIVLYGAALYGLIRGFDAGALSGGGGGATFMTCIYFSAETFTSLGFGDVVPLGPLRLIAGVETLNGLLLIGWSASYIYIAMERFWKAGDGRQAGK